MSKFFVIVILIAALLLPGAAPVSASPASQSMNVPDQLAYIDAQINVFANHLVGFQQGYKDAHGIYFQSLESHSYAPDVIAPPDGINDRPGYQNETLAVLWSAAALPWEIGWSFSIDTYNGPAGQGYVLNVRVMIGTQEYRRSTNWGPETYRSMDWYPYVDMQE